jgi:hypothetical protein
MHIELFTYVFDGETLRLQLEYDPDMKILSLENKNISLLQKERCDSTDYILFIVTTKKIFQGDRIIIYRDYLFFQEILILFWLFGFCISPRTIGFLSIVSGSSWILFRRYRYKK